LELEEEYFMGGAIGAMNPNITKTSLKVTEKTSKTGYGIR
jgi:hypothetical protein